MTRSSRAALVLLLLVLIAGGVAYAMRGQLALAAMGRVYDRALDRDAIAELPDGLHVGLCGSGSPMADPTRVGPCVAVVAGKQLFVVDSGSGSTRNLSLMNLPPPRVSAVFITHFHSDHIADLGELMLQRWAGGAHHAPLPIYGPAGIEQVVDGFEAAYQLDRGERIAHHGEAVVPPSGFGGEPRPFPVDHRAPDVLLIDEPDLKVFAFPVEHHPAEEAVGYLFIYKGRRLVISGDTSASPRLEAAAKGADLLAHEGLQPSLVAIQHRAAVKGGRPNVAKILSDIPSYHATPEQAAAIAERAGVGALLFYHEIPPIPMEALEGPFLGKARDIYKGPIQVGRDGDFISMPAGSTEIVRSNRLKTFRF
jgi:ribonuclease Z